LNTAQIRALFPRLKQAPFYITSEFNPFYNCIAFAAEDTGRWWWPVDYPGQTTKAYWPAGVDKKIDLPSFIAAFATLGYVLCGDGKPERGFVKVALFADANGIPKHAARQLPTGKWTSKLGVHEDISHILHTVEGKDYGNVVQFLKRPLPQPSTP